MLHKLIHRDRQGEKSGALLTIFHVTHQKAGSQWIAKILRQCAPERYVEPEVDNLQLFRKPVQPGRIYPTVYLRRRDFERIRKPADSRIFIVIRDLRDTLVSAYYSIKTTHPEIHPTIAANRAALQEREMESGLLYLMDNWLPSIDEIQRSWIDSGSPTLKYEELLGNDMNILSELLLEFCQLQNSKEEIERAILINRFSSVTGTRESGIECQTSHERKGIAGDWKNHFSERLKASFKERFGRTLILLGYENDLNW